MRYGETWPTGQQSGGPAVIPTPARPTPARRERVLRYHVHQLAIGVRILMDMGVLIPADPASGAWWRVDPAWRADMDATRRLNLTPNPGCPDCHAGPGTRCHATCLRYRSGR